MTNCVYIYTYVYTYVRLRTMLAALAPVAEARRAIPNKYRQENVIYYNRDNISYHNIT